MHNLRRCWAAMNADRSVVEAFVFSAAERYEYELSSGFTWVEFVESSTTRGAVSAGPAEGRQLGGEGWQDRLAGGEPSVCCEAYAELALKASKARVRVEQLEASHRAVEQALETSQRAVREARARVEQLEAELARLRSLTAGDPSSIYHEHEQLRVRVEQLEAARDVAVSYLEDQLRDRGERIRLALLALEDKADA